jgi:hypothetical protein
VYAAIIFSGCFRFALLSRGLIFAEWRAVQRVKKQQMLLPTGLTHPSIPLGEKL